MSGFFLFFFNDTATTEIYTLSLHDALPISRPRCTPAGERRPRRPPCLPAPGTRRWEARRSEEHTSELQSLRHLVCRLLLGKKTPIQTRFVACLFRSRAAPAVPLMTNKLVSP